MSTFLNRIEALRRHFGCGAEQADIMRERKVPRPVRRKVHKGGEKMEYRK